MARKDKIQLFHEGHQMKPQLLLFSLPEEELSIVLLRWGFQDSQTKPRSPVGTGPREVDNSVRDGIFPPF
ncbi:MAG TPA: hypothetical protein VMW41_06735 [Candidatus Bathyarchaeia archaeon]|nr:hypothetical protein [Candidatus Bathyarchaeia archaeon]